MNTLTNGQIFLYETLGTATLLLLGCGVVANAILRDSKGFGGGWLLINFGWGLGVYMGVYVAFPTGAHLNPARDLSPRIAHAILPIPGKGSSDWAYSWVPIVGPIIGSVIATLLFQAIGAQDLIDAIKAAAS